jgi:predicted TIM-barrel fold metal-dependent hydrolase
MAGFLDPKRFLWVFFVDSFLFPLDNSELTARNIDLGVYVPLQEKLLKRELGQAGLSALPKTFPEYLAFVSKILEQNRAHGGVSIKFEIAYFRSLHFDDPPESAAASIYRRYNAGGKPSATDRAVFEDFMFRYLLREAGRLHLAVQIHTAVGTGDFFSVTGGNVLNLENVLRDPRYSNVNFVLLHGGYPFQDQAIWLAARENVYLDSSLMGLYLYPADLAEVLRHWLLLYPDKVVFGSDAFPFSEAIGAEESDWLAIESARRALAAAISRMILNGEVSEQRALQFAHAYLHDNAARIYPEPLP